MSLHTEPRSSLLGEKHAARSWHFMNPSLSAFEKSEASAANTPLEND